MRSTTMLSSQRTASLFRVRHAAWLCLLASELALGHMDVSEFGVAKPTGSCPFIGKCPFGGKPSSASNNIPASDPVPAGNQYDSTLVIPDIPLKHIALALRLTSQLNNRLQQGMRSTSRSPQRLSHPVPQKENHALGTLFRGGENQLLLDLSEQQQEVQNQQEQLQEETSEILTSFHVKFPFQINGAISDEEQENKGTEESWGPDIEEYFTHVLDALELKENEVSLELALTMIYLDRACSVETARSNGLQRCPFCTPQTVHRLSLVALLTALRSTRNDFDFDYYHEKLECVLDGIPREELQFMMDWMQGALGDSGYYVSAEQLWQWTQTWSSSFENFPVSQKV